MHNIRIIIELICIRQSNKVYAEDVGRNKAKFFLKSYEISNMRDEIDR